MSFFASISTKSNIILLLEYRHYVAKLIYNMFSWFLQCFLLFKAQMSFCYTKPIETFLPQVSASILASTNNDLIYILCVDITISAESNGSIRTRLHAEYYKCCLCQV